MHMWENAIIYEQPVNEHTRVCLRLERLFQQADHHLQANSVWHSRASLATLLDILLVLDRPDLKTKLTKELLRHISNFTKLEMNPSIDNKKLKNILAQLASASENLQKTHGKFAQALRENELLNNIRQYSLNPGGACSFEIPAYHFWLEKPEAERKADLQAWFAQFDNIRKTVDLVMQLVRESSDMHLVTGERGFYQTMLDPQIPCQLIQVQLPRNQRYFPEISVSRHGVFIRVFAPQANARPKQVIEDVSFKIACCIL